MAKGRYACRKYTDRKVEREKLMQILEAGRVAPTGANRQPQRLVVIESKEGMERLGRCTRDFGAPLAILVCADTEEVWQRKYDGKQIADIDAAALHDGEEEELVDKKVRIKKRKYNITLFRIYEEILVVGDLLAIDVQNIWIFQECLISFPAGCSRWYPV